MSKISLKTQKEIALIAQGGRKLKEILKELVRSTKPGLSLEKIDNKEKDYTKTNQYFLKIKEYFI